MKLVFDIEANGLIELQIAKDEPVPEADRVWCMVIMDIDTHHGWTFKEEEISSGVNLLRSADLLIGHNIISYDIPLLERLHGSIDTPVFDTLILSKLMYPDRQNHPLGGNALKDWGKFLKCEKMEYDLGFSEYKEEMLEYCKKDVIVSRKVYFHQLCFAEKNSKPVSLEHKLARIITTQTNNGIGFDVDKAHQLEHDLLMEKVLIEDDMSEVFPPITEERWSDKTGKQLKSKTIHFNPASRQQIAQRLKNKYKWNAPKTDKGNPKVDSSVLKELPYPEAKALVKYFDIVKLLSQVQDWITRSINSRDGRIHGSVNTQGTVTGRMTASQPNLQQVSNDPRARALFIPRDTWSQVGIDASGLEARLLANRMARWDGGAYGDVVINGDIHSTNQTAAGLDTRSGAKTFFFALIYGAGDAKIGKIVGKGSREGKEIKNKFLNEMPALKNLINNCHFQVAKKGTLTLLDGREVPCRANHKALNVQIQGDGAILMKLAQTIFYKKLNDTYPERFAFMATVHDEWQLECEPEIAEDIGKLGAQCISEAGRLLDCVVPMDGSYRVGSNWAECH